MFSLVGSLEAPAPVAHVNQTALEGEQLADIMHARHRVIAERELANVSPLVRKLVEDAIPNLIEIAAKGEEELASGPYVGGVGDGKAEQRTLLRFFTTKPDEGPCRR